MRKSASKTLLIIIPIIIITVIIGIRLYSFKTNDSSTINDTDINSTEDDKINKDDVTDGDDNSSDESDSADTTPAGHNFSTTIAKGDDLTKVMSTYNFQAGDYEYSYEFDPYGDGCTDISQGVYDGTLPDFEKKKVLDYFMLITFGYADDQWVLINHNTDDTSNYEELTLLKIDINGTAGAYEAFAPYQVMSVETETLFTQ